MIRAILHSYSRNPTNGGKSQAPLGSRSTRTDGTGILNLILKRQNGLSGTLIRIQLTKMIAQIHSQNVATSSH